MAYRNGNYASFYVSEPFSESNLGAYATKDFLYYSLLRTWKGGDSTFPFIDSHDKNYNVRDDSDWEKTLKPRIHERLRKSKNIVLFLSSITKNSKALREEVDYGMNDNTLPVIVVYPEYSNESDIIVCSSNEFRKQIKDLWDRLPKFRDSMGKVSTIHVPNKKQRIREALEDTRLMVTTQGEAKAYSFSC